MMKIRWMKLIFLFTLFLSLNNSIFSADKADKPDKMNIFKWKNTSLKLPFSPKWAVEKPRKNPHDPLNFMDASAPAPRIIGNLSETHFNLALKDFSAFREEFLKSKNQWVKDKEGLITENPIVSFESDKNLFRYEFSFSVPEGEYKEFGHYQRCDKEIAFSLRVMIPKKQFESAVASTKKIIDFFRQHSACIH